MSVAGPDLTLVWTQRIGLVYRQRGDREENPVALVKLRHSLDSETGIPNGPRQANLVLIAYASSEGSGEPAHPRSLARTFAARSYKQ